MTYGALAFGTRVGVTGLTAIIRSRTAQPKNADSESRNRFTDDSAKPLEDLLPSPECLSDGRHLDTARWCPHRRPETAAGNCRERLLC